MLVSLMRFWFVLSRACFLDFRHGSNAEGRHLAFYCDMSVAVFFNRSSTKKIFGLIFVDMVTLVLLNSIF